MQTQKGICSSTARRRANTSRSIIVWETENSQHPSQVCARGVRDHDYPENTKISSPRATFALLLFGRPKHAAGGCCKSTGALHVPLRDICALEVTLRSP